MNIIKKSILLASIAMVAAGSKACREDYCVACKATVGTVTPSATPSGTATQTPTVTPTGTLSPTPTGATPTPTETAEPDADQIGFLRKLSASSNIRKAIPSNNQNPRPSNWLGNIDKKKIDSDADGYADWFEKDRGADLTDPKSFPDASDILMISQSAIRTDADRDGLSDQDEILLGTDPVLANTDQDGCLDGPEYLSGTNPRIKDSIVDDKDGDCLSDEIEKQLGTDLSNRDSDRDKLSDSLEVALGLNPLDVDTDFDGIFDWKQVELLYSN
jgi:hypothetical protein